MSKNKYKNKDKDKKNPSNFSEGGLDKSILSNYSQWRMDYDDEKKDNEEELDEKLDDKNLTSEVEISKENSKLEEKSEGIVTEKKEETVVEKAEENPIEKEVEKKENDEEVILTETQRLQLIYGNVVPLHERRRLASSRKKKKDKIKKAQEQESNFEKVDLKTDIEIAEPSKEIEKKVIVEDSFDDIKSKEIYNTDDVSQVNDEILEKETKENISNSKQREIVYAMPKIPKMVKGLFALSIIFAIAIVGFFGVKAYHSLSVKYPAIVSGLESKNTKFYTDNLVFKDRKITNEEAELFITQLKEDELRLKTLEKWLEEDSKNLKKDKNYISARPIRLQKYGKVFGMFDDYKIVVDPIKLKIEKSDKVSTKILINGNEEEITDSEYELFPGKQTIIYNDNGVKLKNLVSLFPDENNEVKTIYYGEDSNYELANELVELDTTANDSNFKIRSRDENSILFVNDKNTGLTVKQFNELNGTNIKKDDVLKVVSKLPWGYTISEGITYDGESNISVSTSLNDSRLLDVAIARTLRVLKEFVVARANKDLTVLTVFTGRGLEYTTRDVNEVINSGREFIGGYPSMEFDLNSFEVSEYSNTYKMFIGGHLLVQQTSYGPGDRIPNIAKITPEERTVGFHFIYDSDSKQWLCEGWGFTAKYITRTNIKSVDLTKDMIVK